MKKAHLILILIFFTSGLIAQSIAVVDKNGDDISGTEITTTGLADDFEIVEHFYVKNISGTDKVVLAKRTELDVECSTQHALCWELCPEPTSSCTAVDLVSSFNRTITPGGIDETGVGHHYPNGALGTSKYRYEFYVDGTPSDKAIIDVVYDHSLLSVNKEEIKSEFSIIASSSDILEIKFDDNSKYEVQIFDLLGNVIHSGNYTNNASISSIEVSNSIYLVRVLNTNTNISSTKKIILE